MLEVLFILFQIRILILTNLSSLNETSLATLEPDVLFGYQQPRRYCSSSSKYDIGSQVAIMDLPAFKLLIDYLT